MLISANKCKIYHFRRIIIVNFTRFYIQVISEQEIEEERNTNKKAETKGGRKNNCKVPCLDKVLDNFPVLKRKTLWTVVGVFSTFRFGTSLPRFSQSGISKKIKGHIESTTDSFVEDLTVIIGTLVGIILSYLARKCSCLKRYRRRGLDFAFTIVSIACQVIGFSSAVTLDKVGYHIYFNLILMALKGLSENIRTEAMPDVLGSSNIKITEGLLHMFTGLAGIVAETVHSAQRTTDGQQDWKKMFKIGGGCLLMNGLLSEVYVMSMLFKHPRQDEDVSNKLNEDGNESNQDNEDFAVVETSSIKNAIKSKLLASKSTDTNILTVNTGTMTEPFKTDPMPEPLTINVNPLPYSQPTYSKARIPATTPSRNSTISPGTVAAVIDCPRYVKALMPPYKRTFPKNM
ncbi:uncharacterized protein LOC132717106 [Ruditapes philippinarum]|uniref:uncharacterized protein LOC132717106 n=1 Tax=Ruditapes philippinarum TaxID=129788 RepID=UPI00295BB090|nr:uncharacterized protein LOC132717106 [Ruditapes philippinarum]